MGDKDKPTDSERNEPVKIDLDPELALRALLEVDPDAPVPQDEPAKDQGDALARKRAAVKRPSRQ